jgi:hypothetical protein
LIGSLSGHPFTLFGFVLVVRADGHDARVGSGWLKSLVKIEQAQPIRAAYCVQRRFRFVTIKLMIRPNLARAASSNGSSTSLCAISFFAASSLWGSAGKSLSESCGMRAIWDHPSVSRPCRQ